MTSPARAPSTMSDIVLEAESQLPEDFNPCVTDTFLAVPTAGIVVVPWRVFQIFPEIVHPKFRTVDDEIVYDGDVNILMSAASLSTSDRGYMEELTQSWVIKVSTEEELDTVTGRLSAFPSLLCVTLTIRNVMEDNSEIPMVIFISPEANCMKNLTSKLADVKEGFGNGKKFSLEVDLGPSLQQWGKTVLRREFLSVGGRFCVTSGAIFNHVFDWNNILGCVPCLPCGVIGSSAYRIHRKINYQDEIFDTIQDIVIIGTKGLDLSTQQEAVYLLMQWIKVFRLYYCMDCRRKMPPLESGSNSGPFCTCNVRITSSPVFGKNKVAPLDVGEDSYCGDPNTSRSETGTSMTAAATVTSTQDGKTQYQELHGESRTQKTQGRKHKSKQKKVIDDNGGPFAPYREKIAGRAIARRKKGITQQCLNQSEIEMTMNILNARQPGGGVQPKQAVFKYPAKRISDQQKKAGQRRRRSGFQEIQLKMADGAKGAEEGEANVEASDVTLDNNGVASEDGCVDNEDDVRDVGFFFVDTDMDEQFERNPLGQTDLQSFLTYERDPKTGTVNPGFGGQPVLKQPKKKTESIA
ncbi:uncharacterized protein LOC124148163 [Haliotis rufescens]|uniref:uncharacterized protein LOC124148163 n=1 Tax=Haliotis rufescens TaxID=6454 RepID=UPI00201F4921|nr:uncharacterized protein LOC124148163 [Haliotis rufescens]XP_048243819.1 uncharacterized protein LOC124148163 [Haliotis rufescens]XP_048243820.1 uncharacterized protein LOC124148163 [Haliotis rufescens]